MKRLSDWWLRGKNLSSLLIGGPEYSIILYFQNNNNKEKNANSPANPGATAVNTPSLTAVLW